MFKHEIKDQQLVGMTRPGDGTSDIYQLKFKRTIPAGCSRTRSAGYRRARSR